ncbi:uncharacterized protein C2845_PM04G11530 [Panicum miliaceum]|uniref:RecF/RecN/SMC N-terminal domain-containing protein n=1 Tax=Panicum miliaceum TaxID=4540 RepID=A0A3L6QV55_PANMI|nr:uncharacterized protein C2845_PM04G11530 [Panicum miliaceum]
MAAGTISRIRLENFIGAGGKSAILTALCVAFGCRAKNTQRAASLKDFIKTGCSCASILVDINNHGEDAFKPEVFGNVIILERRITESSSSTVLKDQHGRKVAHRKDDLVEIIEHFNFFFKATLLQQVNDLLGSIRKNLNAADSIVEELERSITPVLKELDDIQDKIKNMEHIVEIAHEIENLKKKLAWAWVYDVDKKIGEQTEKLEKLRERIPACQERIDRNTAIIEELRKEFIVKKENVRSYLEKTQEVRRMKEKMQHDIHEAQGSRENMGDSRNIDAVELSCSCSYSLRISQVHVFVPVLRCPYLFVLLDADLAPACPTIVLLQSQHRAPPQLLMPSAGAHLQMPLLILAGPKLCCWSNMRAAGVEEGHQRKQVKGDSGAFVSSITTLVRSICPVAVKLKMDLEKEHARGMQVLNKMNTRVRQLEAQVNEFQLQHMQQTQHFCMKLKAEVFQVEDSIRELQQEINSANLNATRLNDEEKNLSEELQDIIKSISDIGKEIDEDGRKINQLKYQIEDLRQCQRDKLTAFGWDGVQSLYRSIERHHSRFKCPPIGPIGYHVLLVSDCWSLAVDCALGRLLDAFIVSCHKDSLVLRECAKEVKYHNLQIIIYDFTKPQLDIPNHLLPSTPHPTILSVIHLENPTILNVLVDQGHAERQVLVRDYEVGKSVAFDKRIRNLKEDKAHYEGVMERKVLAPIKMAESELTDLQQLYQEYFEKASRICAESEVEALGGVGGSTMEQLSDRINKLNQKFQQESRRYTENIDDLRALHDNKGRKILRKQQMYAGFRDKLNACQKALDLRWRKFQRNAGLLKRQLTWLFNEHLGQKGISGHINVDYKNEVLSVELTMPQDASRDTVRDTRGLSGGERSFSTLCFTLALHGMTEAPFRAMDEFDVFMDAVSRKISLDTLVDFAVAQGSQWIFITPHDIRSINTISISVVLGFILFYNSSDLSFSMVKAGDRIKKQQMAAPRG